MNIMKIMFYYKGYSIPFLLTRFNITCASISIRPITYGHVFLDRLFHFIPPFILSQFFCHQNNVIITKSSSNVYHGLMRKLKRGRGNAGSLKESGDYIFH